LFYDVGGAPDHGLVLAHGGELGGLCGDNAIEESQ
jgi:hypothetical protein